MNRLQKHLAQLDARRWRRGAEELKGVARDRHAPRDEGSPADDPGDVPPLADNVAPLCVPPPPAGPLWWLCVPVVLVVGFVALFVFWMCHALREARRDVRRIFFAARRGGQVFDDDDDERWRLWE